jgi:hypothetical protein
MYLVTMGNILTEAGTRIWMELEYQVGKVRRFDVGGGKTGKGVLHFWTTDPTNSHGHYLGQYRAVDLEDVVAVNYRPTRNGKK